MEQKEQKQSPLLDETEKACHDNSQQGQAAEPQAMQLAAAMLQGVCPSMDSPARMRALGIAGNGAMSQALQQRGEIAAAARNYADLALPKASSLPDLLDTDGAPYGGSNDIDELPHESSNGVPRAIESPGEGVSGLTPSGMDEQYAT